MDEQSKLEKSTGYSLPIQMASAGESVQQKSTGEKKASPVLTSAPMKGESKNSTGGLSVSKILAIQIVMGDFKALKKELPHSRTASSNGKIYWCIEAPGHDLKILDGNLLVDGQPVDYKKLLEDSDG